MCKEKFGLWKFWKLLDNVKYQKMAQTIRMPDGSTGTYEWLEVYCKKCVKKHNL